MNRSRDPFDIFFSIFPITASLVNVVKALSQSRRNCESEVSMSWIILSELKVILSVHGDLTESSSAQRKQSLLSFISY